MAVSHLPGRRLRLGSGKHRREADKILRWTTHYCVSLKRGPWILDSGFGRGPGRLDGLVGGDGGARGESREHWRPRAAEQPDVARISQGLG